MLMYCKKCGRVVIEYDDNKMHKCDICGNNICPVPEKYLLVYKGKLYDNNLDDSKKDQFIEDCIKSSPEFDPELYNKKDAVIAKRWSGYKKSEAISDAIAQGADPKTAFKTAGNIPHCPICGSAKLSKISTLNRAVSVSLFGIFSKKIGKQWHCNQCGTDF